MSDKDRLTARDKVYATAKAYALKQKGMDRLTQRDVEEATKVVKAREAYKKATSSKKDRLTQRDIETYQNDRTTQPDSRMFQQPESEQILRDEKPEGMKYGGMGECRGSKAIKGKKFSGVF